MASKIVEKWVAILDRSYKGAASVTAVKVPVIETAKRYRTYEEWRELSDVAKQALHYRRVVPKHEMFDTEYEALQNLEHHYSRIADAAHAKSRAAHDNWAVVSLALRQFCVNEN